MKRALRFVLIQTIILIIVTCTIPFTMVSAASNTYKIDELGLEVSFPSDFTIITEDISSSDPIFDRLGTTKSALISQFKAGNIYLNAIPNNSSTEEIVVTMTNGVFDNLSVFSDGTLKTLASSLTKEYENYGITVTKYDVYQHSQAKFIRIYFTDTANSAYGLQYYTNYGAKAMNFTMRSYDGPISSRQETTIKTVVDSIKYNTDPPSTDPPEQTNSREYLDKDTGVKFTVPANWPEKELSKEREFIDVKFASTEEEGLAIMYGSVDLWSQMSASDKAGYSRSDFDNSQFTISDMEEYFAVGTGKVSKVTYNGAEYFITTQSATQEMYGTEFTIDMTRVVRFRNGWLHEFQFGGTRDNPYFSDFEALLNTVEYPNEKTTSTPSSNMGSLNSDNEENDGTVVGVVIFLLVVVGIVVFAVIYTRKNKQDEIATSTSPIIDEEDDKITENARKCPNCGQELPLESAFCHICGTKINFEQGD